MNSKFTKEVKYWAQILMLPIYWFSFIIPRNKKIWLFGSTFGRRFADNPRYFYLYVNQYKCQEIRPIWISKNEQIVRLLTDNGMEAYYYKSIKGIWYSLRGKVYIFDNYSKDINFWLSGRALKVNLWHGIPLKKIQMDNIFDKVRHPENARLKWKWKLRRLSDEKPSHYVLTTSNFLVPIFSSAFATKHVLTSGYPRNDVLINDDISNVLSECEAHNVKVITEKCGDHDMKMVYYMPTFRETETMFFDVMDLERFKHSLHEHNILFCVKLHPKSKLNEKFKALNSENMLIIDKDADPYVFLTHADVLISDYSSIYFDYLLTGKPILFFDYDLKEYLMNSREMYFDYDEFTPGKKVRDMDELLEALSDVDALVQNKEMAAFRKKIREKVFDKTTGLAGERLYYDITKVLNRE